MRKNGGEIFERIEALDSLIERELMKELGFQR